MSEATPKEVTQAAVLQADRDATVEVLRHLNTKGVVNTPAEADMIRQIFACHRIAATERAAAYVEAQAKQAEDTYDLISVQSTLPVLPPMFSCDGLRTIATAIREEFTP